MRVAVEKPGADGKPTIEFVDPARPMTIQDLLRHTSGLIYAGRGDGALNTAWRDAKVGLRAETNAQLVTKLSGLALRFSPGQRWEYGVSTDVLGRVVEVVTGKSLGEALEERIHKPLGMVDTAFVLPAGKVPRAAQPWQKPGFPPMTTRFDVGVKAAYESGGGGLVGSTADYLRFASMLANNGSFGGKRILGKQTVAYMTADHVRRLRPGLPRRRVRPSGLQIEMTFGDTSLSPVSRPVQSLLGHALKAPPEIAAMSCVDPFETAADKISALAWRTSVRDRASATDDPSIVRHLHDLAALAPLVAGTTTFAPLARKILDDDARRTKAPDAIGLGLLRAMLPRLAADPLWRTEYEQFVRAVSFGPDADRITFDRAVKACQGLVERVVAA